MSGDWQRNSYAIRISRDTALMMGLVDPTPDEQTDRLLRWYEARQQRAAMDIPAAIRSLDALTEPTARAVLDHHSRANSYGANWQCSGCDQGCSCDSAGWPCSTVAVIAEIHGVNLTDADMFNRPADGSLDLP